MARICIIRTPNTFIILYKESFPGEIMIVSIYEVRANSGVVV